MISLRVTIIVITVLITDGKLWFGEELFTVFSFHSTELYGYNLWLIWMLLLDIRHFIERNNFYFKKKLERIAGLLFFGCGCVCSLVVAMVVAVVALWLWRQFSSVLT